MNNRDVLSGKMISSIQGVCYFHSDPRGLHIGSIITHFPWLTGVSPVEPASSQWFLPLYILGGKSKQTLISSDMRTARHSNLRCIDTQPSPFVEAPCVSALEPQWQSRETVRETHQVPIIYFLALYRKHPLPRWERLLI